MEGRVMAKRHGPITVRGVTYPDVAACAAALGLSPATVYSAIKRGTLDNAGRGSGRRVRMPVRIRGTDYPDIDAAAAALGVTEAAIRRAADRGAIDRVGLPRRPAADRSVYASRCKPVTIGGVRFSSRKAASEALGLEASRVSAVLRHGSARQRERLIGLAMAYAAQAERRAA
jgi:hypothetical protein